MITSRQRGLLLAGISSAAILSGCAQIFGLDKDFSDGKTRMGGAGPSANQSGSTSGESTSTSFGTGGDGGARASGTGGGADTGSAGSGGGASVSTSGGVGSASASTSGAGGGPASCMEGTFRKCPYSGAAGTENVGPCKAATQPCSNGIWGPCQGEIIQIVETCNNVDDDCDGVVDDGNPGGGQFCPTGKPGVCGPGTATCVNGSMMCVQNVGPSAEVCDGLDNNCNGAPDELTGGSTCDSGQQGICAAGHLICHGASGLSCDADNDPGPHDFCNGLDNDCDGIIDAQECFVAGTHVAMADGSDRAIELVNVGDWVLGYDLGTETLVAAPVTKTFMHPLSAHSGPIVRVNESLRATTNHPFYANGRWIPAGDLFPGDALVMLDRIDDNRSHVSSGAVSSLVVEAERETTYNIEVAGVHDYFAEEVLVHNKPLCP